MRAVHRVGGWVVVSVIWMWMFQEELKKSIREEESLYRNPWHHFFTAA